MQNSFQKILFIYFSFNIYLFNLYLVALTLIHSNYNYKHSALYSLNIFIIIAIIINNYDNNIRDADILFNKYLFYNL